MLSDQLLGISILSYAIMYAEVKAQNTTDVVKTLLGLGADPTDVPKDMWVDYIKVGIRTLFEKAHSQRKSQVL